MDRKCLIDTVANYFSFDNSNGRKYISCDKTSPDFARGIHYVLNINPYRPRRDIIINCEVSDIDVNESNKRNDEFTMDESMKFVKTDIREISLEGISCDRPKRYCVSIKKDSDYFFVYFDSLDFLDGFETLYTWRREYPLDEGYIYHVYDNFELCNRNVEYFTSYHLYMTRIKGILRKIPMGCHVLTFLTNICNNYLDRRKQCITYCAGSKCTVCMTNETKFFPVKVTLSKAESCDDSDSNGYFIDVKHKQGLYPYDVKNQDKRCWRHIYHLTDKSRDFMVGFYTTNYDINNNEYGEYCELDRGIFPIRTNYTCCVESNIRDYSKGQFDSNSYRIKYNYIDINDPGYIKYHNQSCQKCLKGHSTKPYCLLYDNEHVCILMRFNTLDFLEGFIMGWKWQQLSGMNNINLRNVYHNDRVCKIYVDYLTPLNVSCNYIMDNRHILDHLLIPDLTNMIIDYMGKMCSTDNIWFQCWTYCDDESETCSVCNGTETQFFDVEVEVEQIDEN